MSKYFSLCARRKKNIKVKQSMKNKTKRVVNLFNVGRIFLMISMIGLAGLYVFSVNNDSAKGFELSRLENQQKVLMEQNKQMENKMQQFKSLAKVQEKVSDLDMVNVEAIEYLPIDGNAVALVK
ncbi:MAG TPA: hypothetical protein PLH37_00145 [bacterium]|nr:hypothetical protein [bacterium]